MFPKGQMKGSVYIILVEMLLALAACGKEAGDVTDATSTTEVYTSVQDLLLKGEYQKAEARIDSMHRAPSLTKEQRSMVYLLRSRLHQLRNEDPYRATKYMKLHVELANEEQQHMTTPWIVGSMALLLTFGSVGYYTRHRKSTDAPRDAACTFKEEWKQAKRAFAATASGRLILTAADNEAFTGEERKRLLADIEACFIGIIQHIRQEAPHTNREETLYCICSGLRMSPRRMADCLLTTLSTLRSRKARLRNKLPEYMYGAFFYEQ